MLIKFCKPEHNILDRSHTIRFGTFEYYREMNPEFSIADAAEGIEINNVDSMNSATSSPEAVEAVRAIAPLPHIHIKDMQVKNTFPNCYIWCCSKVPETVSENYGDRFSKEYTSSYEIKDPMRFAEHLFSILMTNVTRIAFSDSSRSIIDSLPISDMGEISLKVIHRDVLYVDEKISDIKEGTINPYIQEIPPALRPIFVKPTKYSDDKEYRFVFLFEHRRHGALSVRKDPMDLPVIPIKCI